MDSPTNCSRKSEMAGVTSAKFNLISHCQVAHMGEGRGVHKVLVGKPEGKRQLGRPRRKWEDNTKMDL